jgi:hypothetical protein
MKSRRTAILILLAGAVSGQTPVAPTPETVGRARGEDWNGYNVVNSFELGYRFRTAGGDIDKYRSDVNYGNGLRLLSSSLTIYSKEGHGKLFDELVFTTQGVGNDPYESSSIRIQKNRLFRYDMMWRSNEYFNPALTVTSGEHFMNTTRRLQDHDLVLLPQSKIRFFLGYSRNTQDGPALTTVEEFASHQDEFPIFANIKRLRNEYRLGTEVRFWGARFSVLRGWDNFKEETTSYLSFLEPGNNPNDRLTLSSFLRNEPYYGNTPYWRLSLSKEQSKLLAIHARYNYAMGRRDFVFDEAGLGTNRFGAANNRQVLVSGSGRRPVSSGSLTLSLFPTGRITITNHTSFNSTRMEGNNSYSEILNSNAGFAIYNFDYLGIRTISNVTEATLRASKWLMLSTGYNYTARQIRSVQRFDPVPSAADLTGVQDNHLHAGMAGIRFKPWKPVTVSLDAEIGRADRPIYPVGEKNYQAFGGRVQYKLKSLLLSAATKTNYNLNSVSLSSFSAHSRNYALDGSWAPLEWFSFDVGYSKIHLDTVSGIAYFALSQPVTGQTSVYISNMHVVNAGVRFSVMKKRVDLFAGYSRVQDTGDGRLILPTDAFQAAQTFPLSYDSPLARVSVRLLNKVRLNFGYQYYNYNERFLSRQDYRAHTGYTSVLWSF